MVELKYKGWDTLPIGKYEEIKALIREGNNSNIEILSILTGVEVNKLQNMRISEIVKLFPQMDFLTTKVPIRDRLIFNSIKINGERYKINTDFKNISVAQYMDFKEFYEDYEGNYCNLLATFIIPEGHKYNDGYDVVETAEIIKDYLSVEVAENAIFFFAKHSRSSLMRGLFFLTLKALMMVIVTRGERRKMWMETARELIKQSKGIVDLGRLTV